MNERKTEKWAKKRGTNPDFCSFRGVLVPLGKQLFRIFQVSNKPLLSCKSSKQEENARLRVPAK